MSVPAMGAKVSGALVAVCRRKGGDERVPFLGLKAGDKIIRQLVHRVDRAGADIEHDVIAAHFILMDHPDTSLKMPPTAAGGIVAFYY